MRPDWTNYFLGLAFLVSRRSRDIHTKHGCILVNQYNHIIGVGYNSFPTGMDDTSLPTNRPLTNDPDEESKYPWMLHSEENAILNSSQDLHGAIAYITGQPCHHCSMLLAQKGVVKFVIANRKGWQKESEKTKRDFDRLVRERGIEVKYVSPDLSWILDSLEEPLKLGFLPNFKKWIGYILRLLSRLIPVEGSV